MARHPFASALTRAYQRNLRALTKATLKNATRIAGQTSKRVTQAAAKRLRPPSGKGDWLSGMAIGLGGARRYHLYRPEGLNLKVGEKLPLMVMLHGAARTAAISRRPRA